MKSKVSNYYDRSAAKYLVYFAAFLIIESTLSYGAFWDGKDHLLNQLEHNCSFKGGVVSIYKLNKIDI